MTATAADAAGKTSVTFVTLTVGGFNDITRYFICDQPGNEQFQGEKFLGEPLMEIELATHNGGLRQEPSKISLPFDHGIHTTLDDLVREASAPRAHPPIKALIQERITDVIDGPGVLPPRVDHLFRGTVWDVERFPEGEPFVTFECHDARRQLEGVALGLIVDSGCSWIHGQEGCLRNLLVPPNRLDDVYMTFASGPDFLVQFNSVANQPIITAPPTADHWDRGYFLIKGLRLHVREHLGGNTFVLSQPPPSQLEGSPSTNIGALVSGCPGSISACRNRSNEAQFGGPGFGIPDYNPTYEEKNA